MKRSNFDTLKAWKERSQKKYQEGRRGNVVRAQDARGTEEPRDSVVQISDYLQAEQAPEEATRARVSRPPRTVARPKRAETPQQRRKREADATYRRNREQRLVRAGGRCEYQVNPDMVTSRCVRAATQTHHVQRRSNGVDHSVDNLRAFCLSHHQFVHLNVEAARTAGWIKATWQQLERRDS